MPRQLAKSLPSVSSSNPLGRNRPSPLHAASLSASYRPCSGGSTANAASRERFAQSLRRGLSKHPVNTSDAMTSGIASSSGGCTSVRIWNSTPAPTKAASLRCQHVPKSTRIAAARKLPERQNPKRHHRVVPNARNGAALGQSSNTFQHSALHRKVHGLEHSAVECHPESVRRRAAPAAHNQSRRMLVAGFYDERPRACGRCLRPIQRRHAA